MPSSEGALEHRRLQLEQRRLAAKHRYMLDPSLQNGHLVLLRCQPQIARALERLRADEAGGTITRERFAHICSVAVYELAASSGASYNASGEELKAAAGWVFETRLDPDERGVARVRDAVSLLRLGFAMSPDLVQLVRDALPLLHMQGRIIRLRAHGFVFEPTCFSRAFATFFSKKVRAAEIQILGSQRRRRVLPHTPSRLSSREASNAWSQATRRQRPALLLRQYAPPEDPSMSATPRSASLLRSDSIGSAFSPLLPGRWFRRQIRMRKRT